MNAPEFRSEFVAPRNGLLATMAGKYGLAADVFERTVAAVAMPQKNGKPDCTREELISCLIVANEHDLNPLTKEIYFMRAKSGVIQPIVSVDGWIKKLNSHPQFDGMEFEDHIDDGKMTACTCIIYRKDRTRPTKVTEYMIECKGDSTAWKKTERRMLRNRTLSQGARIAVGFAGVMDFDEFEQWQSQQGSRAAAIKQQTQAALVAPDIPEEDDVAPAQVAPVSTPEERPAETDSRSADDARDFLEVLRDERRQCSSQQDLEDLRAARADEIEALAGPFKEKAQTIVADNFDEAAQ